MFLVCLIAIPLNGQTRVFSNVIQNSNVYLGIQMEEVTAENVAKYKLNREHGVIVRSVAKGSPAEAAQLLTDDVILEFGGTQVWSVTQMTRLVQETPAGRKVDLVISRDGKKVAVTAQVQERKASDAYQGLLKELIPNVPSDPIGRNFQFKNVVPGIQNENKPRLGVTLQPLTDQLAEYFGVEGKNGVLISSVAANSPSSGKLNPGDVIISIDGRKIYGTEDLAQGLREKSGTIVLKVVRNKKEIEVTVTLPKEENRSRDDKGYKL
jgi:serine protease Do